MNENEYRLKRLELETTKNAALIEALEDIKEVLDRIDSTLFATLRKCRNWKCFKSYSRYIK